MNAFTGVAVMENFHFHEVEKNANFIDRDMPIYTKHLKEIFEGCSVA